MRVVPAIAVAAALLGDLLACGIARANLIGDIHLFDERPPPVPLDLGSVLFHFYQDDSRATLIESLYVERRHGREMAGYDQILLARASSALALGLVDPARRWLAEIDVDALPVGAAPRFDLALARIAFLDGDDARARDHLARLPADIAATAPVQFLRLELARRGRDLAGMTAAAAELPVGDRLWFFGLHNLGVAAHAIGDDAQALSAFDRLAQADAYDDEQFDLTLRAGLQAAALVIGQGGYDSAIDRLAAMPGAGPYGRAALGAHARVSLAREDYPTAARVFAMLARSDAGWDPHRLAALIGEPYALERGAGRESALGAYRSAVATLEARGSELATLAMRVGGDRAITAQMAELPFLDGDGLRAQLLELDGAFAGVDWLSWLASGDTQRQLAGFRQLQTLAARLAQVRGQAIALSEAAVEQERRVERAAYRLDAGGVATGLGLAEARMTQIGAAIEDLRDAPRESAARATFRDALATVDERATLMRLARMRSGAAAQARDDLVARIDRLRGRIAFDIEADAAARRFALETARRAQASRLAALVGRADRIRAAEGERRAQFGAAAQMAEYRRTVDVLAGQVQALAADRGARLLASLAEQIERDRRETELHLAYARLAVARINDALMMARAPGATP